MYKFLINTIVLMVIKQKAIATITGRSLYRFYSVLHHVNFVKQRNCNSLSHISIVEILHILQEFTSCKLRKTLSR